MPEVIRHWQTRTRLELTRNDGRVRLTNHAGNVMFDGTEELFTACCERGQFEFQEN